MSIVEEFHCLIESSWLDPDVHVRDAVDVVGFIVPLPVVVRVAERLAPDHAKASRQQGCGAAAT